MKLNLRERYVAALELCGHSVIPSKSRKYITITAPRGYYFVGKSGALRQGYNSTTSIPVSDKFKETLLGMVP